MTEGAAATATAAGHGAAEAAKDTVHGLLDLFLGILLPLALVIAGFLLAKGVGGYVVLGNFLWNSIGQGANAGGLTGPANGALTSSIVGAIMGSVTIAFFHMSNTSNKWAKYALRAVAGFFGGLTAYAGSAVIAQAQGTPAGTTFGNGGVVDQFFNSLRGITQSVTGIASPSSAAAAGGGQA
jgi:hypothetical protein